MYDPIIGRWLEEDPIGFDAGDMDLYRIEGNDPTNEVDPSGLQDVGPNPEGIIGASDRRKKREGIASSTGEWKSSDFWQIVFSDHPFIGAKDYEKYRQGCLGLAKVRLGLPLEPFSPMLNEGVTCFSSFEAASKYRDNLTGEEKKRARIFAAKYQGDKSPEMLKEAKITPKTDLPDEIDPRTIIFHGGGDVATLHEPPGNPAFWEDMNHGLIIDPDTSRVFHRAFNPKKKYLGLPFNEGPVMYCVYTVPASAAMPPPSKYR